MFRRQIQKMSQPVARLGVLLVFTFTLLASPFACVLFEPVGADRASIDVAQLEKLLSDPHSLCALTNDHDGSDGEKQKGEHCHFCLLVTGGSMDQPVQLALLSTKQTLLVPELAPQARSARLIRASSRAPPVQA